MATRTKPRESVLHRGPPLQETKLSATAEKAYRAYRAQLSATRTTTTAARRRHGYLGQPLVVSRNNTTKVKVNHMDPGNVSYASTVPTVIKSLSAAPFLAEDLDDCARDFLRRYVVGDKSLPSESFLYNELYKNMDTYTKIVDDVTMQCKRAFHRKTSRNPEDESYLTPERQRRLAQVVAACDGSQTQTCIKRRSELEAMHRDMPHIVAHRAATNALCFEYSVPQADKYAQIYGPCKAMTHGHANTHPYVEMSTQYGDRFVKRVLVAHAFEDALHASAFGDNPQDSMTAAPARRRFAFRTPKYNVRDTVDITWNAKTRSFGTGGPQVEWMQLVRRMYDVRRLHNVRAACSDVRKRAEHMAQGQRAGNNFTRHSNRYAPLPPSHVSLILSKMALPQNLGVTEYGYVCADPKHPHDSDWHKSYTRFGRAMVCSDITNDEMQLPFGGYTDSSANNDNIKRHSSYRAIIRDHLLSVFINQVGINIAQTNPGMGTQGRYGHVQTMRLGQQSPTDVLHALQATRMFSYRTADNKAVSNVDAPWILQGGDRLCAHLGPSVEWQMRNARRLIMGTRSPNWEEEFRAIKKTHDDKGNCAITAVRGMYNSVQDALERKCDGKCDEYASVKKARQNYQRVLDQIRKRTSPNVNATGAKRRNAGLNVNAASSGNNRNVTSGNNRNVTPGNNRNVTAGNNRNVTAGNNRNVTAGNNRNARASNRNNGAPLVNGAKQANTVNTNRVNAITAKGNNKTNNAAPNRAKQGNSVNTTRATAVKGNTIKAAGNTNNSASKNSGNNNNEARRNKNAGANKGTSNNGPSNRANDGASSKRNAAPIGIGLTKSMQLRDNILLDQNVVLVDGEIYNNCAPPLSFLMWSGNNDVLGISERTHIGDDKRFRIVLPTILPLDVTAPTFPNSLSAARQMVHLLRNDAHSGTEGLVERLHENVVQPLVKTGQITKAMHFDDLIRRWRIIADGVNSPEELIKITSQPQNYKTYKCLLFYIFSHAGFSTPQALKKIEDFEDMSRVRESHMQMLEVTASLRMIGDSGPMPPRLFAKIVDHAIRAVPHKPTLSQDNVAIEYAHRMRRGKKPNAAMGGAASWVSGLGSFTQRLAASRNASRNARATGRTLGPARKMATAIIPARESIYASAMHVKL